VGVDLLERRSLLKWGLGCAASAGLATAPALSWAQAAAAPSGPAGQAVGLSSASGSSAGTLAAPSPAVRRSAMRSVAFDNLHTGESIEAVYWDGGDYIPDVLDAVNTHLRDYRTGDVHVIAPELLDLLDQVAARTETRGRFQVISGYRSPRTNAMLHERSAEVAKKSFHLQGMAIDVRLPDVELHHLHAAAQSLGRGGVGYYPESNFVHIDVGPVRAWEGV
jgi:uncharacterized protein YcbK (DUF882 family)